MPVIVLSGDEEFELNRRVEKLKSELLDPDWRSFNLLRLNKPGLDAVIDAACTLPFGPGNKVVLIEDCDFFTKKRARVDDEEKLSEKAAKDGLERFDQALSAVAPNTYLVFVCPHNFDKSLRISKVINKYADPEEFRKDDYKYFFGGENASLRRWCIKEAKLHGATIQDEAITYLLDSTEGDLRQISSEVEKAALYVLPGTHITYEAISSLSTHHSQIFALLDLWVGGKRAEALASLAEVLSRQNAIPVIAALHTTLGRWLALKSCADKLQSGGQFGTTQRLSIGELSRRLAVQLNAKPFLLEKDLKRIKDISAETLARKQIELSRLEYLVKSGQMPDHQALTVFIAS